MLDFCQILVQELCIKYRQQCLLAIQSKRTKGVAKQSMTDGKNNKWRNTWTKRVVWQNIPRPGICHDISEICRTWTSINWHSTDLGRGCSSKRGHEVRFPYFTSRGISRANTSVMKKSTWIIEMFLIFKSTIWKWFCPLTEEIKSTA